MSESLGMLETLGLTGLIEGADAMSKAARVELLGWDKVGAGLATVFCRGDVAAVKSAIDAGAQAASKIGEVHSVNVIARPHDELWGVVPSADEGVEASAGMVRALGLVETRGATGVIEASDAMVKSADVEVVKVVEIGGGYITVMVTGDVGSVSSAVSSGREAAERVGELVSAHVIARPSSSVVERFCS